MADTQGLAAGQAPLFAVAAPAGRLIGKRLTLLESDGRRAVFLGATPIYVYDVGDGEAERACIAMLSRAGLAFDVDIARAFGCHRNTVARLAGRLAAEGLAAVMPAKRGPKGAHKVTPEVLAVIDAEGARLGPAALTRVVRERTGVGLSREHVRRLRAVRVPADPRLPAAVGVDVDAADRAEAEDVAVPVERMADSGTAVVEVRVFP